MEEKLIKKKKIIEDNGGNSKVKYFLMTWCYDASYIYEVFPTYMTWCYDAT